MFSAVFGSHSKQNKKIKNTTICGSTKLLGMNVSPKYKRYATKKNRKELLWTTPFPGQVIENRTL